MAFHRTMNVQAKMPRKPITAKWTLVFETIKYHSNFFSDEKLFLQYGPETQNFPASKVQSAGIPVSIHCDKNTKILARRQNFQKMILFARFFGTISLKPFECIFSMEC